MPKLTKQPDVVTTEYIEAKRLGVLVRTPLENVSFFKAEHKAVVAYTKANGSFTMQIPLHEIEATLEGVFMAVHRSYLVKISLLPGLSTWRTVSCRVFEILTTVSHAGRTGIIPHTIPVSRRLNAKVGSMIRAKA